MIDVGRKLAAMVVVSIAVAIAGRVVVEPDRDIVVVDPEQLVFDQNPKGSAGSASSDC
jgi:hypothetical protein